MMEDKDSIVAQIINQGEEKSPLLAPLEPKNDEELAKIPLYLDKHGSPRKIRANLTKLLTYYDDDLIDLFIYNEATHNIEVVEDRQIGQHRLKKGIFTDTATKQIASYIANKYFLDYKNHEIADEVEAVALMKSYNPIKDFLNMALSEKQSRDPFNIIREYLNIEDTEYNRLALDLFFRGAIARVFYPGCQFDFCLDLVGQQGGRKTTFLRQLFKEWYTDQIRTYDQKDDLGLMVQAWLVNDEELEASKKQTFGGLKKVVTMTVVSYRPPYARTPVTLPVDFVFSRTTNEAEHLGDATGDRRFLGVRVGKTTKKHKKTMTDSDRIDIWGNYYASYLNNKKLYYDEDSKENRLIEQEREQFKRIDDVLELLTWYLEQPIPVDFFEVTTEKYQRRQYYTQLLSTGRAFKSNNDREHGRTWIGTLERDRVNIADICSEIFPELENDRTTKKKVRTLMNNMPNWEKSRRVRFGNRVTSGYLKKI